MHNVPLHLLWGLVLAKTRQFNISFGVPCLFLGLCTSKLVRFWAPLFFLAYLCSSCWPFCWRLFLFQNVSCRFSLSHNGVLDINKYKTYLWGTKRQRHHKTKTSPLLLAFWVSLQGLNLVCICMPPQVPATTGEGLYLFWGSLSIMHSRRLHISH